MENEVNNKKPYKIKDVTRQIKKAVVASNLQELQRKSSEKFGKTELPQIHLDCDGTEIDDEDYFQTLEDNTELIAVFRGEQWIDRTHYVTITTHDPDTTDSGDIEKVHLKKLVGQLKTNLSMSVLSEADLELLSNMDPNSVSDLLELSNSNGKNFIEHLKETSGRILHEKRQAYDAIELLKLIKKHQQNNEEHHTPSSSTTSLSTMSSFSSNCSSVIDKGSTSGMNSNLNNTNNSNASNSGF